MSRTSFKRRFFVLLTATAVLALTLPVGAGAASKLKADGEGGRLKAGTYIVQMLGMPVVAYEGGLPGLRRTAPGANEKIDPLSTEVVNYVRHLTGRHGAALKRAGGGKKLYSYAFSFNGFAAKLTARQANALAKDAEVLALSLDEKMSLDTSSTPDFLGLNEPGGLYSQLGGKGSAGDNVVVGIVDSGIWPESLSFADRVNAAGVPAHSGPKLAYKHMPGWRAKCQGGEQFNNSNCNQKLIGARYYNSGWGGNAATKALFPYEYISPRDADGHGTHTASTAAGNANVPTTGPAAVFGPISGIAPRARVSAYKVCWGTGSEGGCFSSDSVAAIDQAVADGVDVINFSISGSRTNFRDPVEIAFLFAADAGVFVATSAGNEGPTVGTVAHPGPWLTTVAAGTHNRAGTGSVTLGNGATYTGASVATAVGPAPFIDSMDAGLTGANSSDLALCFGASDGNVVLDPAKVSGKIVLCDRGVTARVNKSLAVQEAGGIGMVLVNTSASSLNGDFHFVPTVHLAHTDRAALKAYATTPSPTATINASTLVYDAPAPFTAAFSSRGPLVAGGGDLLKPDVIAPGEDILAAVAPPGNYGRDFDMYSGTSMSSPHVAGLAALLSQKYPSWSPMAIKSALMTTGRDVLDGGPPPAAETNPILIFRQGAGHVTPNDAANPGLVFDSGFNDWIRFICGVQPEGLASLCASFGGAIDPSDLNTASIAIGDLAGSQTVTRTVRNVGSAAATYTASVNGMSGIDTVVSPSSLTLNPGQEGTFTVTFTQVSATPNAYTGGQLRWTSGGKVVRVPIVVRPVALAAPAFVSSDGSDITYDIRFGYTGAFSATARGLAPALVTPGTVTQDPDQTFNPADSAGTVAIPVTIPAGTTYARYALFDSDVSANADLDLYVYLGATLVGASTTGTSQEEVNFTFASPTTGDIALTVYVHGWGVPAGTSPFILHEFYVPATDAGNMSVSAPAAATLGVTGTITLSFSGLAAGTRYLGSVAYSGAAGMPNPTIVSVNTP
ncbi:hypothetical protein BH23CHL7_BH23CHL7_05920 [soil metagenome]